jgi:hypothetical protein
MERVLPVKKSKREFVYRPRPPEALLKRLGVPRKRTRKPFYYTPPGEQAEEREIRKRKRLGVKHDPPVSADGQFIVALKGLVTWRRLSRALAATANGSRK